MQRRAAINCVQYILWLCVDIAFLRPNTKTPLVHALYIVTAPSPLAVVRICGLSCPIPIPSASRNTRSHQPTSARSHQARVSDAHDRRRPAAHSPLRPSFLCSTNHRPRSPLPLLCLRPPYHINLSLHNDTVQPAMTSNQPTLARFSGFSSLSTKKPPKHARFPLRQTGTRRAAPLSSGQYESLLMWPKLCPCG